MGPHLDTYPAIPPISPYQNGDSTDLGARQGVVGGPIRRPSRSEAHLGENLTSRLPRGESVPCASDRNPFGTHSGLGMSRDGANTDCPETKQTEDTIGKDDLKDVKKKSK